MAFHKALKDLNLLDRFLFAEAMEDPVIMQTVLEIILGRDIVLKYLPQTEKEQRQSPLARHVRLDVRAVDTEDNIYDTEVQKEDTKNLPKRSRLYQGMIDTKLLEPGNIDFNSLNDVYTIIICPFDLFGKGLYRYTFQMACKETPGIALNDGSVRIFLNTRGTDPTGVTAELIELLHYMEHTTEEMGNACKSKKIKEMQRRIAAIKSSEEIGVKFMQAWEERILDIRKAREEGVQYQLFTLVFKKLQKDLSAEEIADILEEDLSHIQDMYTFIKERMDEPLEKIWEDWSQHHHPSF